jgi:hypothetical protein
MSKAKHPCAGRSEAQIETFELIAIGRPPPFRRATITALERDGLIVKAGTVTVGRDCLGPIEVPVWDMPLHHHMAWCEWCAANVKESVD